MDKVATYSALNTGRTKKPETNSFNGVLRVLSHN